MNRQDVIKLAKLSGRSVLKGIKIEYELVDGMLSSAQSMANSFSGSSMPTPLKDMSVAYTKKLLEAGIKNLK